MKNKQKHELAVCGYAAVKALEARHSDSICRLYFSRERSHQFGELCRILATRNIPYNIVESDELQKLCGSLHHQGVVAMIHTPRLIPLTKEQALSFVHKKERIVLLDRVGNANNLGAIVRSAAFFGIKNIILPVEDGQTMVTTSTVRIAQGGMEYVDIYSVRSPTSFLQDMQGKMVRIATDVRGAEPISHLSSICKRKAAVVVLGNEETGVSENLFKLCDYRVVIPGIPFADTHLPAVESLNVAHASSIVFYEFSRKGTE